jgi:cytochrome P450
MPLKRTRPFDPPSEYARLRACEPVSKVRTPYGDEAWIITRYDDVRAALVDKRISSDSSQPGFPSNFPIRGQTIPGFFMQMDPPEHTRLRRMLTREFTNQHVKQLQPEMAELVSAAVREFSAGAPPADLLGTLLAPLTWQLISELIGVPRETADFFADRLAKGLRVVPDAAQGIAEFEVFAFWDMLVAAKREHPTGDLIGRVVEEYVHVGDLEHDELVMMGNVLLNASYDTTVKMAALGFAVLLAHPDQYVKLVDDPSLARNTVDELLRYLTINHTGVPRVALEDVEIGGQTIRAGEGIVLMLNSANRDEDAFETPERFDIHHQSQHHLAFGAGRHKCLGSGLATAYLDTLFTAVATHVPTLRLAVPADELPFGYDKNPYYVSALPVSW